MEGEKELLWVGIRKSFVQKKNFWFVKMGIFCGQRENACAKEVFVRKKAALSEIRKAFCKRKAFGSRKRAFFQLMQSYPIKKSLFQHTKFSTSHRTKANVQLQNSSATTYCELAVQ